MRGRVHAGCVEPKGVWGDLMRARWRRAGADFDWGALETAFDDLRAPLHISTVEQHTITKASLKAHGVENLWIMDASVFPAPITLNIQYTVMAAARVAAQSMPL